MLDKIQSYLQRLDIDPYSNDALDKLASLVSDAASAEDSSNVGKLLSAAGDRHATKGNLELTLQLIDLELLLTDDGDRADLLYRKGRLLEDEMLDEGSAVQCYERILQLRPGDAGAEERLSHIGLVRENWRKIVDKYLDEAKASTDKALTTSLYRSVAEIIQKNDPDSGEVEAYLRTSLEVDPSNAKSAGHLSRLLMRQGKWDKVISFYEDRIAAADSTDEQINGLISLAQVLSAKMGDRDGMKSNYRRVLELDAANSVALSALADAYQEDENWDDLIGVYEKALQARGRGEVDYGMYIQIGMLYWKKVGKLEPAEPYFARVQKHDPTNAIALDFYREYYTQAGEQEKLLRLLKQAERRMGDVADKVRLGEEMANIAEAAGNSEKAIDTWKSIQRRQPDHPEAKNALRRLYELAQKWNALLEILKDDLESLPEDDVAGRVGVLHRMVDIYRDRLNLDVMVINTYNSILSIDPANQDALNALADKYESMNRWNDLIGVLSSQADLLEDVVEKKALLRRVANLWLDKFSNPNKAIHPLEAILELDSQDEEAFGQLKEIYQRRRNWRGLLDLHERELEHMPAEERRPKLVEMAELAQKRLGDPKEAINAWNRLLEVDNHDADAIEALLSLYEREQRWPALAEMLERRIELATEDETVGLLERLGAVWGDRMGATERGIETWRRVLAIQPGHSRAMRVLRDLYATAGDWRSLETLFAEQGNWPDFIETLHTAADRVEDPALKIELYFKVADTWTARLEKPERAIKAYERVLGVDGTNLRAAKALVPIYELEQKWPRLIETYQVLLGHATEAADKLDLYEKLWVISEQRLGSKSNAFAWCARAYELAPDNPVVGSELERLAAESESYDELVQIYDRRVVDVEGEAQVDLYRRLARLSLEQLGRPAEAQRYYEAVLERHPEDRDAIAKLERIFEALENWPRLLEIYDKRVALEEELDTKLALLFRMGTIQEDFLQDTGAAVGTYRRVVDLQGDNLRALRALEKLHTAREEWPDLAQILEQQLRISSEISERVNLEFRLGELNEQRLSDPRRAIDYYKDALSHDPLNRRTVANLERFLDPAGEFTVEVAGVLAPFYETTEAWQLLARALEILLDAEEDPAAKLELMKRLSVLYGRRLQDAPWAYENSKRVFRLSPHDGENRAELRSLAEQLGQLEDLIAVYAEALAEATSDLQLELSFDIATIYDNDLGRPAEAQPYYEKVLQIREGHPTAFEALRRILQGASQWEPLRELLGKQANLTNDAETKKELLFAVCSLNEDVLADVDQAIDAYRAVLDLEPGNERSFAALERLYQLADRWADLESLLAQELGFSTEPPRMADLQFRRGQLLADRLEDPDTAVDLFTEVLTHEPNHEPAIAALEALQDNAELRQRVASILEPRYRDRGEWGKLINNLEVQLEAAPDAHGKVDLLAQIAELQGAQLMNPDAAFATWRRALVTLPADERVREALDTLIDTSGRWIEAAEVWEEGLRSCDESDIHLQNEFMMRLARLNEEKLGDPAQARHWYRTLLDKDPTNLEMARPAAEALGRLYEADQDWPNLIGILRREVEWATEPLVRRNQLIRIAEIQEGALSDAEKAIETYREIIDAEPEDRFALDNLERLFFQAERWRDLIDVLQRRVSLSPDSDERRELLSRIAMLHEEALEDPQEACSAWLSVLDDRPTDLEAVRSLARLYEAAERYNDLYEMLERELDMTEDPGSRVSLTYRLGVILHRRLDDAERAIYRYRDVLEVDRDHEGSRTALRELLADSLLAMAAAEILEPIYAEEADWDHLSEIYALKAKHSEDPAEKVRQYRRLAETREAGMHDTRGAFDYYGLALKEALAEPELQDILANLERLTAQDERWQDLVELYKEVSGDILDAQLQEQVRLTVAQVSRNHLGDAETSRDYFRKVLEAAPDNRRALDALEEIYQLTEDYEALLQILLSRADAEMDDPPTRRAYLARGATLCEEFLERTEQAIDCWEQVMQVVPGDYDAAAALERLYETHQRWADLVELLEGRFMYINTMSEAVDLRFRLGELFEQKLNEPDQALQNYRGALGGNPRHDGAIEAIQKYLTDEDRKAEAAEILEPIFKARQDWPNLIEAYKIRRINADEYVKPELSLQIAMLYEEQLEDLEQAFEWYGKLFLETPDTTTVRDQLTRLAGILEKWGSLAEILEGYLTNVYDETQSSLQIATMLASIFDDKLDNVDKAKEFYLRVLQYDRENTAVFQSLEAILTRSGRWHDLLDVYNEAAEAAMDPQERVALLYKVCMIWEEALGNLDEAIDAYRAVLDHVEDDRRATAALDRLFVQMERWADLVELLHRQLDYVQDAGAIIPIKLRLGMIYETRMNDVVAAIDAYDEVMKLEAQNPDGVAALERLVMNDDYEEHRLRLAQMLEPIYRDLDEWRKLVVIQQTQLAFIDDRTERVEVLRSIAQTHLERAGDEAMAFEAMARAWYEDVTDEGLLAELEALAQQGQNWHRLVEVLTEGIAENYDPELLATVWTKIARVQEEALLDPAAAIASYEKLLEVREESEEALNSLERLLPGQESWPRLVEVLKKKAELTVDTIAAKELYYKIAEIYATTLENLEEAIATWRHILTIDETDDLALGALEHLYREGERWTELVEIYQRRVDTLTDPSDRRQVYFHAAWVYEAQLNEAFEAISAYRTVLGDNPQDTEALNNLNRLFTNEKMWPDLIEVVDQQIELAQSTQDKNDLLYRAGWVLQNEMDDVEGAIDRFRRVLEADPGYGHARHALEYLVQNNETARRSAAAVLEPLYRADTDWGALVNLFELQTQGDVDALTKVEVLKKIAELREEGLSDVMGAFNAYGRALAEDASDRTITEQLERIAKTTGVWAELAELYEKQLNDIYDDTIARELVLTLARVYEEELADDEKAIEKYNRALDYTGDELPALTALDRLLERNERWAELGDILTRRGEATTDPEQQATLLFRLGVIRQREFKDIDGALQAYREVLDRQPDHQAALDALESLLDEESVRGQILDILEPVYETAENWAQLTTILMRRLDTLTDNFERAALLERIGELWEHRLGDPGNALNAFGHALIENPLEDRYLDTVARLGGDLNRWADAAAILENVLAQEELDDAVALRMALRCATWHQDHLGDIQRAEHFFRLALTNEPENVDALARLETIYRQLGDVVQLVGILEKRAELEYDMDKKQALLVEVADLAENSLDDVPTAIRAWRAIAEADETNRQAQEALVKLYERGEDWDSLIETLGTMARYSDPQSAGLPLLHRVGEILITKLEDTDRAIDAYNDCLDIEMLDDVALTALEGIYRGRESWHDVQDTLMRRLSGEPGPMQIDALQKLALLAEEKFDNVDDAVGYYHQILGFDPDNAAAGNKLRALLEKHERWYDLIDLLKNQAEQAKAAGDTATEVSRLVETARIWEEKLESSEGAAEILQQILASDPSNVTALNGLARMHENAEEWDKCKEVLSRAAALGPTGTDAAELYFRMGRVEEKLGENMELAFSHYATALQHDQTHAGAQDVLEKAYRKAAKASGSAEDWMKVVEIVYMRATNAPDANEQLKHLCELGMLYTEKLNHPDGGLPFLEQAMTIAPEDPDVLKPLADIYFAAGRLEEAEPLYRGLVESKSQGRRRSKDLAPYLFKLAGIAEARGQIDEAAEQYDQAYKMDTTYTPTVVAIGRLAMQRLDWEKARRTYRSMLLQNIDEEEAGITKADVYYYLGLIHEQLSENAKAINMLERGLELDPEHGEIQAALSRLS